MPVEIRELIVRTTVDDSQHANGSPLSEEQINELKDEIIEECFEMLMKEIRKQEDR